MIKEKEYSFFRAALLEWFAAHQRDLPWRGTYDPYHVWISEIMLQQTQMERGVEYFNRWIRLFPEPKALVAASEQEILKAWEGLGYYSRARNIRKAAAIIVEQHGGRVPADYDRLLALPGIGPYTAAAIMAIAFDRPHPVVDANVERVFARLGDEERPVKERTFQRELHGVLQGMLAQVSPRELSQALMEMGALVCTPRNPDCPGCPVQGRCAAFRNGTVALRPVLKPRPERIEIVMACAIVEHEGKMFIQQRLENDVWGGLWEFPGGRLKDGESPEAAAGRELHEETEIRASDFRPFATVVHHYTRYRVTLHSYFCRAEGRPRPRLHAASRYRWAALPELSRYAFPSGHRQLIARMKTMGLPGSQP
ncbi:MAG: A/G-specific adenine glycosylase [Desulfobulbaceae bacterium]